MSQSESMVERVAKAVFDADRKGYGLSWEETIMDLHPEAIKARNFYRSGARAAIAAMREPTEEMLEAIATRVMENIRGRRSAPVSWDEGYRIMIDAILGEPK